MNFSIFAKISQSPKKYFQKKIEVYTEFSAFYTEFASFLRLLLGICAFFAPFIGKLRLFCAFY